MSDTEGTVTKRRLTWAEFWKIRPDLKPKPANDNDQRGEKAA